LGFQWSEPFGKSRFLPRIESKIQQVFDISRTNSFKVRGLGQTLNELSLIYKILRIFEDDYRRVQEWCRSGRDRKDEELTSEQLATMARLSSLTCSQLSAIESNTIGTRPVPFSTSSINSV
jgi:hypothetical protein